VENITGFFSILLEWEAEERARKSTAEQESAAVMAAEGAGE
jgi:hypothetical protein